MVRLDIHFRAELHWPGKIELGLGVTKFGRTSVDLFDQVVFSEGKCVASAHRNDRVDGWPHQPPADADAAGGHRTVSAMDAARLDHGK